MTYLDVAHAGSRSERQPPMLDRPLRGRQAWTAATLDREDYLFSLSNAALVEIERFVATLRRNPLPVELVRAEDYDFAATRPIMRRLKAALDRGVGFGLLDRLPVDAFDKSDLKACYWVLSQMIARPVAQSFTGNMLYDVIDTGQMKGPKVRADKTRQDLTFHTDYGYNLPPRYIGLQVLRTARAGGRSGVVSLTAVHEAMRRRHPDLLPRLYRPFHVNRYGEHAPGDPRTGFHPVFVWDGKRLWGRFNHRNIIAGYEMAGVAMDPETREAIDALNALMFDPALGFYFDLEPGQIQYLMNWACAHCRTEYEDFAEEDRKRHLVRIFLRDEGARSYNG